MAPDPQQGKLTEVDSTFSKLGNYTQLDRNTKDDRGGSVGPDNIDPFLTHIGKTVGNAEDLSLMGIVMLASTHLEPDYS